MDFSKKQLNITFLGTGTSQGIPMIANNDPVCLSKNLKDKRLRSSVLISWDNVSYTVDCGLDFRQQMLQVNCETLAGILFTHEHADHTAGIDDIRPFFFKQGEIPVYGSARVIENLSRRFDYIFSNVNKYPGAPSVNTTVISHESSFKFKNKMIHPIQLMHNTLSVLGYRIDEFAYLTDIKTISNNEIEKLSEIDVLVLSALRIESHPNHLNLEEALKLIHKINPRRCYLTHISHLMGFHDEVSNLLPENVFLAYDTLTITSD